MALVKRTEIDKIEIVGPDRTIQIREVTIIEDNGVEIGRSNHRKTVAVGEVNVDGDLVSPDLVGHGKEIAGIAATVWTPAIKKAKRLEGVRMRLIEANDREVVLRNKIGKVADPSEKRSLQARLEKVTARQVKLQAITDKLAK